MTTSIINEDMIMMMMNKGARRFRFRFWFRFIELVARRLNIKKQNKPYYNKTTQYKTRKEMK